MSPANSYFVRKKTLFHCVWLVAEDSREKSLKDLNQRRTNSCFSCMWDRYLSSLTSKTVRTKNWHWVNYGILHGSVCARTVYFRTCCWLIGGVKFLRKEQRLGVCKYRTKRLCRVQGRRWEFTKGKSHCAVTPRVLARFAYRHPRRVLLAKSDIFLGWAVSIGGGISLQNSCIVE